jgi:hypothetical protein
MLRSGKNKNVVFIFSSGATQAAALNGPSRRWRSSGLEGFPYHQGNASPGRLGRDLLVPKRRKSK